MITKLKTLLNISVIVTFNLANSQIDTSGYVITEKMPTYIRMYVYTTIVCINDIQRLVFHIGDLFLMYVYTL